MAGAHAACTGDAAEVRAREAAQADQTVSGVETQSDCKQVHPGAVALQRLNRAQYLNTVQDLMPSVDANGLLGGGSVLPADESTLWFAANAKAYISSYAATSYMDAAEKLAASAVADLRTNGMLPCVPGDGVDLACGAKFIQAFGRRALRHSLDANEQKVYADLFAVGSSSKVSSDAFADGVRVVVTAMLQSPDFLYHIELGEPADPNANLFAVPLTGAELASRVSFFLWNSGPDDALLDAGPSLREPDRLREQVKRMLGDPRGARVIWSFYGQYMGISDIQQATKDDKLFPQIAAQHDAYTSGLFNETVHFANYVTHQPQGDFKTLMTAPYTLIGDDVLFDFYGVARPKTIDPAQPALTNLDPKQRAGLLTQGSFLFRNATPTQRGKIIRQSFLCQQIPPPPPDVMPTLPDAAASTARERLAQHTTDPSCATCHRLMDPLGFGFGTFNAIGAYQTTENGQPIDSSGEILGSTMPDTKFADGVQLAQILGNSSEARDCFALQWFRFAAARVDTPADACDVAALKDHFASRGGNLLQLIEDVVMLPSFAYHHIEPKETS